MDPNQQPAAPAPQPAAPAPVQISGTTPPPMATPVPNGSKKKLIISIVIAAVVLTVGAALAWFMYFSPAAQAKRASTAFMNAATKGETQKLYELSEASTSDEKEFVDGIIKDNKGSYKLKESLFKDGKGYFLYELTGAKAKNGRTIVEKQHGKWLVSSYYWGDSIRLVPSDGSDDISKKSDASIVEDEEADAKTSAPTACLVQDDYKWANYDKNPSSVTYDTTFSDKTFNWTNDFFFEPDSTKMSSLSSIYDDFADFYNHTKDKQWKFRLRGSIYQAGGSTYTDGASVKLANDRAAVIEQELIKRGVPADRIVIDAPIEHSEEYQQGFNNDIYRRVEIVIDPTCTAR